VPQDNVDAGGTGLIFQGEGWSKKECRSMGGRTSCGEARERRVSYAVKKGRLILSGSSKGKRGRKGSKIVNKAGEKGEKMRGKLTNIGFC